VESKTLFGGVQHDSPALRLELNVGEFFRRLSLRTPAFNVHLYSKSPCTTCMGAPPPWRKHGPDFLEALEPQARSLEQCDCTSQLHSHSLQAFIAFCQDHSDRCLQRFWKFWGFSVIWNCRGRQVAHWNPRLIRCLPQENKGNHPIALGPRNSVIFPRYNAHACIASR